MVKARDVELRGRLGVDPHDKEELKLLSRILRVTAKGLKYEAGPRHTELLARALGLEDCKPQFTPGAKDCLDHEVADGIVRDEACAKEEMNRFIGSLMPNSVKNKPSTRFNMQPQIHEIPDALTHFGIHPQ